MTLSIKRARQRAKTLAAESGISHQQALDAIGREYGWGTWSAMLQAQPDFAGVPLPPALVGLDPLDPVILARGDEVREKVVGLMLDVMDVSGREGPGGLVSETLVRDRMMWIMDGDSPLDMSGPTFSAAVARFVATRLDGEKSAREEAMKSGGFHSGSWQESVQRDLFEAAALLDMSSSKAARIGMADPSVVSRHLDGVVRSLGEMEASPSSLLRYTGLSVMPADFVLAVLRENARGIVLSDWRASVLESLLAGGERSYAGRDPIVSRAFDVMDFGRRVVAAAGLKVCDVFEIESGDAGKPFANVSIPLGDSPTERWLRDTVRKSGEGRSAFLFNPLAEALAQEDRELLFQVVGPIVSMVSMRAGDGVALRSEQLIVDAALLMARARVSVMEISGAEASEVTLRSVHDLLGRHRDTMDQLSLFAMLRKLVDGAVFDEAAVDPAVVDLAIEALAPF